MMVIQTPQMARHPRGISLIEALVALAAMSFGILGVVGLQASLRANAEVSRHRTDAVRIAQAALEAQRATAYADISAVGNGTPDGDYTGFTYNLRVNENAANRSKTLGLEVLWTDRKGQSQSVLLTSTVADVPTELGGSLGLSGETTAATQINSRHRSLPTGAVNQGDGTSHFAPPGATTGHYWVFNNTSGEISKVCTPTCTTVAAFLLTGTVFFAHGADVNAAAAEQPSSPALSTVSVAITRTFPATSTVPASCYTGQDPTNTYARRYYCVVPTDTGTDRKWSGYTDLTFDSPSVLATSWADTNTTHLRVCRYTPGRGGDFSPLDTDLNGSPAGDGQIDGDVPWGGNVKHPWTYTDVNSTLTNQNFLVIKADGGSECPTDGNGPTNTNTWQHQPRVRPS